MHRCVMYVRMCNAQVCDVYVRVCDEYVMTCDVQACVMCM